MTTLDEPRAPGALVVKRTAIGQTTRIALVRFQQRDVLKKGEPVKNPKTGKNRQELVVTGVVMPGHDAPAALGDEHATPAPGEIVRVILRGGAFADWIKEKSALPASDDAQAGQCKTGDVVEQITNTAQTYNQEGDATGKPLTTQAQVDAVPRGQSVGIYGPLTLRRSTAGESAWAAKADEAYHAGTSTTALADDDGEPF